MVNKKNPQIVSYFKTLDTVTKTLLLMNVIAYLFLVFDYGLNAILGLNVEQLLTIGGATGDSPLVNVLLSMFLHYSLVHFLVNMIILLLLSRTINDNFTPMAYLFTYLISGIVGNLISQDYMPNVVSVGASGGIYGLLGLLLVSALFKKKYPNLNSMFMFIFVTAIVFIIGTLFSEIANITAHIIGLLVGCLMATIIQYFKMEVYREES
ncbi:MULTISPECIES: rhomboid family intramembrane serine protease [Staphylococcus]|uniref:rhomboid family intramembrane serine protease n=1 Tax=Staphylococcus TaxID=1279 RepID=UPI000E333B56|nr:rhomboid family intramembrane serine protease [Staphylococcus argenteus]BBD87515.1 rhomboid family intramembrane serine protease [Staphylococcus argenteus]